LKARKEEKTVQNLKKEKPVQRLDQKILAHSAAGPGTWL